MLLSLPGKLRDQQQGEPTRMEAPPLDAAAAYRIEIFIRRYSRETRPWIQFHCDRASFTVNVACAADASHTGGRLACVIGDELVQLEREEGEATVHPSRLLHAVTAMRAQRSAS